MSKIATTLTSIVLFLCISFSLNAQTKDRPNALGFKALALDYYTPNSGHSSSLDNISHGFEASYHRFLSNALDVAIPLRFAVADLPNELDNKSLIGLDALLKLKYYKENSKVVPYLFAGGGYVLEDSDKGHFQVPAGLGVNFLVWKRAYVNLQAAYRYSPTTDRNNLELGLGFIVNLGKVDESEKDTDGDGIPDMEDKCPRQKGSKIAQGCPDKDGDGVPDKMDKCPDVPGPVNGCPEGAKELEEEKEKEQEVDADGDGVADAVDDCPTEAGSLATRGCPDSDGDGVADKDDLCPNEKGVAALNGCPDADGDGIANKDDNCPNTKGLTQFNGCPDSDNDGVADPNDKCPNTVGTISNFGCPEIKQEERDALALATRAIRFETGKATLKTSSYRVLDQIVTILNRYPNYRVSIAGHTDSVGSSDRNLVLSEERAKSCYNYLLSQGFDLNRMSFIGYGETQPISSNSTREGRRLNRRVEFNLYLE
jgi:outer membrane protein OmpA-like peptidoglycan-associated protein